MGPEFWKTGDGKRFLFGIVPRLVDALEDVAKELKRQNDLAEKNAENAEKIADLLNGTQGVDEAAE